MSIRNEKTLKTGPKSSEIVRLTSDLFYFFRQMQIVPFYFFLSVVCSFLATLFNFLGLKLLIPLLRGIIEGDFRTAAGNSRPVHFISRIFPQLHIQDNSLALFAMLLGVIFSAVVIKNMLDYAAALSVGQQIRKADRNIRKIVIERYLSFGKLYFDRVNAGTTSHLMMNAAGGVTGQLKPLHKLLSQVMTLAAYLAVMTWISWQLTLAVILIFPLFNRLTEILIEHLRDTARALELSQLSFIAKVSNLLSCITLVKTYSTEEKEKRALADVSDEEIRLAFQMQKKQQLVRPVQEISTMASLLIVTALMVVLMPRNGAHTVSSYLVFFYIVRSAIPNLNALSQFRLAVATAEAQITRLKEIMKNDEDKFIVRGGSRAFAGLQREIEFRNLNFSYRGKHPVLRGVSFKIPKGKMCAIVGPTGAGKTTLVNLIVRLYECEPGSIFIDGADIREFATASVTKRIGYVSQEPMLFNDTLRANLVYGLDGVSDEAILEALHKAQLDQMIAKLPDGLDTVIGDRGVQLSGGERQRVSIARAFLKDPEILILDEATSALDTKTEKSIQEAIDGARLDRTIIVIAHRLSTIVNADNVVVIEGGAVVEQGGFAELLEKKGKFHEYWELQRAKERNFLSGLEQTVIK